MNSEDENEDSTTGQPNDTIIIATVVPLVLVLACVVATITAGILIYWRRRRIQESNNYPVYEEIDQVLPRTDEYEMSANASYYHLI